MFIVRGTSKALPKFMLKFTRFDSEREASFRVERNVRTLKLGALKAEQRPEPSEKKGSSPQASKARLPARKSDGSRESTPEAPTESEDLPRAEMQAAIEASLNCGGGCCSSPTEEMMEADLKSGIYDPDRDLVFGFPDESVGVGPMDTETPSSPGFFSSANSRQLAVLKRARKFLSPLQCYSFFRHIHRHRQFRNGFIRNMCRDKEDIDDLQKWSWFLASPTTSRRASSIRQGRGYSRTNWPYNNERIKAEIRVWYGEREKRNTRLLKVERAWRKILAERDEYRRKLIERLGPDFDDGSFTPRQIENVLTYVEACIQNGDA